MGVNVEYLKQINFSRLPFSEKLEIKTKGRSTPDILIQQSAVSKNKMYIRGFNSDWYDKMKWLCGCEVRNALFCFPCLLFGGDAIWTKTGFTNMGRMKEKCEKHQNSQKHMENVVSLSLLSKASSSNHLGELYTAATSKHNEQVKKNREVLSKMIDCLKFCGDLEVLLHGQSDFMDKPGVLNGLISFIAPMDPSLQKHLENSPAFRGTTKTIQNELLQNIVEVYQEEIASEIYKTSYLAVMAEDTSDVSEDTRLAIILRYELHGVVHERFWGFFKPEGRSADVIAECLINEINRALKNDSGKLIGHTYYETGVVKGERGSIQEQMQKAFRNGNFIHCYTHQPNVIMKHICSSFRSAKFFFPSLWGIASFFSECTKRAVDKKVNPQIWNNRLNLNTKAVDLVFESKENLIRYFEELQSNETTDKTIQASTGFLGLLRNETFLYWLELFHEITPHVETLYATMQSKNIDGFKIQKALDEFVGAISQIRNSNLCLESKELCDSICEEAIQRFAFTNHLIAAKLFYRENFEYYSEEFPTFEIEETCQKYRDLVKDKLMTELKIFYSRKEFHDFNGLLELLNFLGEEDLPIVFGETIKLIKILVTIPMTTLEMDRCFSSTEKMRTFLGNCMVREELTALGMITIEKEKISLIKNFNEKVIEKFCSAPLRRMDFIYK